MMSDTSMGGREQRLEAQAKDGLTSVEAALGSAKDKTKEGANAVANKAKELGGQAKAKVENITKS